MKKGNNMVTMAIVIGGLGAAYWYVTRYGPNGAAYDATGRQVAATWWDTWFGGAVAQVPAQTQTTATSTTTVTQTPSNTPPPSATVDVRSRLLTASGGVTSQTADQWDYYRNQLFPPALTPQQFGLAFPVRTDPMPMISVDQFLSALASAGINAANPNAAISGLRGVIVAPSVSQVPSMSFGGSLARPRAASVFRNRPMAGGGYIQ